MKQLNTEIIKFFLREKRKEKRNNRQEIRIFTKTLLSVLLFVSFLETRNKKQETRNKNKT